MLMSSSRLLIRLSTITTVLTCTRVLLNMTRSASARAPSPPPTLHQPSFKVSSLVSNLKAPGCSTWMSEVRHDKRGRETGAFGFQMKVCGRACFSHCTPFHCANHLPAAFCGVGNIMYTVAYGMAGDQHCCFAGSRRTFLLAPAGEAPISPAIVAAPAGPSGLYPSSSSLSDG
eukprot:GHUV01045063.1.p1 GENE.GHUV01045063.1~~GHUV01045063.1.p1  ORF type:complete len:173 (+),score=21.57 GHUV01045063.1:71-589(+)